MKPKFSKFSLIVFLALVLTSTSFAQRQTGSIAGMVVEKEGNPLPGATVSISGPALMGTNSYVTSGTGLFRFPALLPGEFQIRVEMPGFKTIVRPGVIVSVGRTTEVLIELEVATVEEEVTVTAASPVVDVESTKLSVNYAAQFLASLPMNRDLYDIQNSVPGAITEGVDYRRTSSIMGGTVRSQLYALDGVPMNDPATFYSMANINVDVYEEIEFEVGGHPAEVGQTDSTYINIVTKSGGNKFSGGATIYYTGEGLAEDLISKEDLQALELNPPEKYTDSKDFSANLGGPIIQDRLWFFVNGRRFIWEQAEPGNAEVRMARLGFTYSPHYDYRHEEWMGFGKLTFQINKNVRYMGMLHYNHIYEPIYSNSGGGDTALEQTEVWDHENTYTTTHQFNWVLNQNSFLDIRGTYVWRNFPIPSRLQNAPTYYDYTEDIWWGASPYSDEYIRKKMLASIAATNFQDDFLGASHEIKTGFEFEQSEYHRDWWRGNPYYVYYDDYNADDRYYVNASRRQGRLRIRTCTPERGMWDVQDHVRRYSGYVQDSVATGRWAINLGLRLDYSYQYEPEQSRPDLRYGSAHPWMNPDITNPDALLEALIEQWHVDPGGVAPWDALTTPYKKPVEFFTLSPRIGVVYDLFGNGKTALKASYSRYYEPVWAAKYNASQIFGATSVYYYWYDDNANNLMDLPGTDRYVLYSYDTQDPNYIYYVDNLKAPYMDEIIAGVEQEVARDFKLGFQFVWKHNGNIVEDSDVNNGYDTNASDQVGPIWIPFDFIDPGWDGEWGTGDDQLLTAYGLRDDRPVPTWKGLNPEEAKRRYWALVFTFDKRMSDNWQLKGSVLWSSFKGNVLAGYGDTEGEETVFDNPNTLINAYGAISTFDRPLQIKIMGTYILPYDFILSAYFIHYSGSAWGRSLDRVYFPRDFADEYGGVQSSYAAGINAEVVGERRRPSYTTLDLRLEKSFSLRRAGKLNLYVDVLNLAGRSGFNINENPYPRLRFDRTPWEYELSSTYSDITSAYGVRSVRFGLRWSF